MTRALPVLVLVLGATGCMDDLCARLSIACDSVEPADRDDPVDADHDVLGEDDDCDDRDASVFPGAQEACNGVDDDCDGAADEDFDETWREWFSDGDVDGFGGESAGWSCEPVGGAVDVGGDCHDDDDSVFPDAAEWCDGVDRSCDGVPLPCSILDDATFVLQDDERGAALGTAAASAGDITGDGFVDLVVGAAHDSYGAEEGGAAFLIAGPLPRHALLDSPVPALWGGHPDGAFGHSVAVVGDVDGDGVDDLLIGAPTADVRGTDTGRAYLFLGPVTAGLDAGDADAVLGTSLTGSRVGSALGGEDLDGDGFSDLLVGAPYRQQEGGGVGAAYVFLGPLTGEHDVNETDLGLVGDAYGGKGGSAIIPLGDLDGDGFTDIAVGAPLEAEAGAVLILLGPISGGGGTREPDLRIVGLDPGDQAGTALAGADLDGDGRDDLVVGSPDQSAFGAVHVLSGPIDATATLANARAVLSADGSDARAGESLATGGDLDGDGWTDVVVGAPRFSGASPGWEDDYVGAAFVAYGPLTGQVDLEQAGWRWQGGNRGAHAGASVSLAGDLDADGLDDLVVGAPGAHGNGAAYVVFGAER